ncbi:MAG: hypothetical protein LCH47_11190 [Proteobacteria bacterium]|nr:hypothetical protein [Pseudomonadota bacterium]
MGYHFREQEIFVQNEVSRRSILKGILVGAAAGVPVAAEANATTDEEQLETCLAQLSDVLARMHPNIKSPPRHYLSRREDGSFRLDVRGDVEFQPFQGDGAYLVSIDGRICIYLVREEPVITLSGRNLGYSHFYGRVWWNGAWSDNECIISPNFIRKLEEASL